MANVYCNRVHVGSWRNVSTLSEYESNRYTVLSKRGELILTKYRLMCENLNQPIEVTYTTTVMKFGNIVSFIAPYITEWDGETKGVQLGGRLDGLDIDHTQKLIHGCKVVGLARRVPIGRSCFVISSVDTKDRKNEVLKYNQEFLMTLYESTHDKEPLYVRYDPDCVPGINSDWPLYLSGLPVHNTRWRILPLKKPHITRFEEEGTPVKVQDDFVLNHCATNRNLGIDNSKWTLGYYAKVCRPILKTYLDIYKREKPNNLWRFLIPERLPSP